MENNSDGRLCLEPSERGERVQNVRVVGCLRGTIHHRTTKNIYVNCAEPQRNRQVRTHFIAWVVGKRLSMACHRVVTIIDVGRQRMTSYIRIMVADKGPGRVGPGAETPGSGPKLPQTLAEAVEQDGITKTARYDWPLQLNRQVRVQGKTTMPIFPVLDLGSRVSHSLSSNIHLRPCSTHL